MASPPLTDDPGPHALVSDTSSASHAGQTLGGTTTDTTGAVDDAAPDAATTPEATTVAAAFQQADSLRGLESRGTSILVANADAPAGAPVVDSHDFSAPLLVDQMDFTASSLDSRDGSIPTPNTASVSPQVADVGRTHTVADSTSTFPLHRQHTGHQIKRKPLSISSSVSSLAAARSSNISSTSPLVPLDLPKPDHRFDRSHSIDSPTLYEYPSSVRESLPSAP